MASDDVVWHFLEWLKHCTSCPNGRMLQGAPDALLQVVAAREVAVRSEDE